MPATSASSHAFGILGRNSVVDLGWEWSVVVNARIAPPRRHALNRMNLLSLNSGGDRRAARLAFEGRVVELLDLLPAFRAYVQMSLPYAVFGVHGIAPAKALTGTWPKVSIWLRSRHPAEANRVSIRWRSTPE